MKKMTYRAGSAVMMVSLSLASVACGGGDKVTAENITLEECQDLFEGASSEEAEETDYDGDDDVDDDDAAIADRCGELLEEAEEGEGAEDVDEENSEG